MKKLFLFAIATMFAYSVSAQFYAGVGVGYGMGAGKLVLGTKTVLDGTTTTNTNIYGSLGKGIKPVIKFGYMFNENMGFELGFNYLLGSKVTATDVNVPNVQVGTGVAQAKIMALAPSLVFKADCGGYTRMGLYLPFSGKTTQHVDMKMGASAAQTLQTTEFKGRFSVGFTSAIGYLYSLNDKMGIYGELEYIGLTIKRNTSEITEYSVAGVDQLPNMKTYQIQTEYVDELPSTPQTDMNVAKKSLSSVSQYSSFGINLGFVYKF